MCFSPTASFIAGVALCAVGRETLKKPKEKSQIAFASIPLIFGIQQLTEAGIWISMSIPFISRPLAFLYLMFAYVLWPVFIPIAVLLMEKHPVRRILIKFFVLCGIFAGFVMMYSLLANPTETYVIHHSIGYSTLNNIPVGIFWLYLAATSFSCIVSGHRMISLFGLTIFASCFTAYQCYANTFVSVWCFFAAILSIMVYIHFHPARELARDIKQKLNIA